MDRRKCHLHVLELVDLIVGDLSVFIALLFSLVGLWLVSYLCAEDSVNSTLFVCRILIFLSIIILLLMMIDVYNSQS